ncbi:17797_t:CDS:2, partial [Gigaspora margarita]
MNIDRKTEQSEVREYKEVDQVSEAKNEKKHSSLVKKEDNKQNRSFRKEKKIHEECKEKQVADNNRIFELKKRTRYPGGKEKVQGCRRKYAPKNKKELTRKEKKKENQHTYLGSGKTEDGHRSALIAPKGVPVVSTNNSALGKNLASFSTDLNRDQNHWRIVAQED